MRHRKKTAGMMAAVMLTMGVAAPAKAAAPRVRVDETMYVNMDYYGTATTINVVKGVSTNGVERYTDYGVYDKVVNMTDKTEPEQGNKSVTWRLPEGNNRFYYQCTMPEGSVELPWTFDISYKLNGAETDASKLYGASGLVELNIRASANKNARAYYKNNMILTVVVPVDMKKCYSVDAPGSQLQSVGNNSVVMFAALPGEDGDYTVRIGTDSYESVGVVMMMVPGTLDALNHIKDLKELKDTWREDGDKMYDSMNELLRSMEAMKTDVTQVKGGLNSLDDARGRVSGNRKQIEALSTQALSDLASVTEQTSRIIPYLETARNAVTDINANMNAIYNTMEDTQDELDRLYDRLGGLKNSLLSMSDRIGQGISEEEQRLLFEAIQQQTAELQQILDALGGQFGGSAGAQALAEEDLEDLERSLEQADTFRYDRKKKLKISEADSAGAVNETLIGSGSGDQKAVAPSDESAGGTGAAVKDSQEESREYSDIQAFGAVSDMSVISSGPSGLPGSGGESEEDFETWSEELDPYADEVEQVLQSLSGTGYPAEIGANLQEIKSLVGSGANLQQALSQMIGKINAVCSDVGNVGDRTASTVSALRGVTDELINLLDDTRVLIDTADSYVPSMLNSLSDTQELLNRLTRAMGSSHDMLSLVNTTMISAGDSLDSGTRNSLEGLSGLLEKSLTTLDGITAVRTASEGMKDTLDEQLDQYEEENNFLNIDPEADKVSFTSSKNPSPNSLQIILRTDEINDDDLATDISDMEDADDEDVGPFARMWRVITEIFRAVAEIFTNR